MSEQSLPTGRAVDDQAEYSIRAEISREMVRLYKEQFGRGPTKARTDFAGPDVLVCTLEHSFTPAEKKMAELGEHQRLQDTRLFFQRATEDEFRGVIERVLGRAVRGFISGVDSTEDISAELFYLESRGDGDRARSQGSAKAI